MIVPTRVVSSLYRAAGDWSRIDGATLSAALAYYGALSLFPFCLLVIAGVGLWSHISPGFTDQQNKLVLTVAGEMSPWLGQQLAVLLAGIRANAAIAGPLGIVSLVLTAVTVFVQVDASFDRIWSVPGSPSKGLWGGVRTALRDRLGAFLLLLGLLALLAVVTLVNIILASLQTLLAHWSSATAWQTIQVIVTLGLNAVLFTALYKVLPKSPVHWWSSGAGGLFAAAVWLIGQRLLETFVISDKYTAYGVLGSFLAVMLWMYYASAVVLFGATFVRNLDRQPGD